LPAWSGWTHERRRAFFAPPSRSCRRRAVRAPAVGGLRDAHRGPWVQGEAPRRRTGPAAQLAAPSAARRELDRRDRFASGDCLGPRPPDPPSRRGGRAEGCLASDRESRQGPGDHRRGAARPVPRRGRHHPAARRLRPDERRPLSVGSRGHRRPSTAWPEAIRERCAYSSSRSARRGVKERDSQASRTRRRAPRRSKSGGRAPRRWFMEAGRLDRRGTWCDRMPLGLAGDSASDRAPCDWVLAPGDSAHPTAPLLPSVGRA